MPSILEKIDDATRPPKTHCAGVDLKQSPTATHVPLQASETVLKYSSYVSAYVWAQCHGSVYLHMDPEALQTR